ncbi:uncharacterized protein LOC125235279 [Leguminivora glycinivorella]|uniref:uncharacterized protein LOC125235279 n=1 Tax=Leguminivora glycinivorella TaxID=1035111 RepID=UPI00200CEF5F|nr:uncharacterized protein LOC125235279 [Leguminivora glycinivorella]
MSDSESETIVPLNNKTGGAKAKKPVQKRKSDAANRSDSEREWEEIDAGTKKVKKPRQAKSPTPRTTSGASKKKTASNPFDVFELFPDDEAFAKNCPTPDQLRSSITQRVADGLTRRAADLEGEFFLELRVYNTADIRISTCANIVTPRILLPMLKSGTPRHLKTHIQNLPTSMT